MSELTLNWFVNDSGIKNLSCIASHNKLDNKIKSVNVLDNIDVVHWMSENELILTTGFCFKDDEQLQIQLIDDLSKMNCAALCIKINRFFDEVPRSMIDEAEKVGLPIIEIPYYCRFSEISKLIYTKLHTLEISRTEHRLQTVERLSECYLNNGSVEQMLAILAGAVQKCVVICNAQLNVISYVFPDGIVRTDSKGSENAVRLASGNTLDSSGVPDKRSVEFIVNSTNLSFRGFKLPKNYGVLFVECDKDDRIPAAVKEITVHAINFISLAIEKNKAALKSSGSHFGLLFDFFMDGDNKNDEEIKLLCDMYGFDYSRKRVCITVKLSEKLESSQPRMVQRVSDAINEFMVENGHSHFVCSNGKFVCCFVFFDSQLKNIMAVMESVKIAEAICAELKTEFSAKLSRINEKKPFIIGIGRCHIRLSTIREAFIDSMRAIHMNETLESEECVSSYFQQLPLHVMSEMSNDALRKIYRDSVKILVDYDEKNNSYLIETLRTYFRCKFNGAETAKKLFLHRNTLSHRLEKIKSLLHMDLNNADELFSLYNGICAMDLLHSKKY